MPHIFAREWLQSEVEKFNRHDICRIATPYALFHFDQSILKEIDGLTVNCSFSNKV